MYLSFILNMQWLLAVLSWYEPLGWFPWSDPGGTGELESTSRGAGKPSPERPHNTLYVLVWKKLNRFLNVPLCPMFLDRLVLSTKRYEVQLLTACWLQIIQYLKCAPNVSSTTNMQHVLLLFTYTIVHHWTEYYFLSIRNALHTDVLCIRGLRKAV